ncbi:hypothetical protein Ddc_18392 [Ditylenchus destructor]|nr:hypothetical protein Ddc_18392 [Ditylenchus destructor]
MPTNFRYTYLLIGLISLLTYYQAASLSHSPVIKHWNASIDATQIEEHFDDNVWFYIEVPDGRSKATRNSTLTNFGAASPIDGSEFSGGTTATFYGSDLNNMPIRWNDTGIGCVPIFDSEVAKLFEARRMYQVYGENDILKAYPRAPPSHG